MHSAESGEFDVLVIPKLSRFGRSAKDNLIAFDRLDEAGVAIIFMDLDVDTRTPFGRMMRTFLSAMAEFESDRISEYWRMWSAQGSSPGAGGLPGSHLMHVQCSTHAP